MPPVCSRSSAPESEAASPDAASRRRFLLTHTLPLLCYLAFITAWSHRSVAAPFPVHAPLDKLAHVIEFLPAGVLLARWWAGRGGRGGALRRLVTVAVLGTLFAVADEVHQSFVPGRTADAADVAADAVGVLGGGALWTAWERWRARRSRSDWVSASENAKYTAREGR